MYRIFTTDEFEKDLHKLDNSEQLRVRKILKQLKEQGGNVGKILGPSSFREKKFDGKRLYYLIYENFLVILVLAISDKKTQQATINMILAKIADYYKYIFKILEKK